MEFFVVVLIFITCMIALALLIYYCQEYRNPKYSFTDNQRDISAIALAIAAPGFLPSEFRSAPHQPGFKPVYLAPPPASPVRQPPAPGFALNKIFSTSPADPPVPPPREYAHAIMIPDDMSSSESSSSEHIYYPPKSTAYSVAKKMSMSANVEKRMSMSVNAEPFAKRMSVSGYSKGRRASIPADVAAYLIARRLSETGSLKETDTSFMLSTDKNDSQENQRKHPVNGQFSERATGHSSDAKKNVSQAQEDEIATQYRNISPYPSDSTSIRSSTSRTDNVEDCSGESKKRRSASPYIPISVVAFHLKNKSGRSGSLYTALRNNNPCSQEQSNDRLTKKQSQTQSVSPSPPKRTKKPSLKPAENHPLKSSENNTLKQNETAPPQCSENICFPKQGKIFPSKLTEGLSSKRNVTPEHLLSASLEVPYQSQLSTPLHTVEEED